MLTQLAQIDWPEWLFGNPWPLAVGLVLLFAALRMTGRRLENKRMRQASWAALGLLALVLAGAKCVETPREMLVRQTNELAQAAIGPDFGALDKLLAPEVKVSVGDQSRVILTGDQALRARLKQAQVTSMSCSNLEAFLGGVPMPYVRVSVQASGAQWDGQGMTTWNIYWKKTPAGWKATELRMVNAPLGLMGNINLKGH